MFISRRNFVKSAVLGSAGLVSPVSLWNPLGAATKPSNRIAVGCIGVGRMGMINLRNILRFDHVQVVAVCDVDSARADNARQHVENHYTERQKNGRYKGCRAHADFRELVASPDIDAVLISTPDHWHALTAIAAARAGKDIYLEKPLTFTIQEGRMLSDTVARYGTVLQVGSHLRSQSAFRLSCEWVRNGRIGQLHTIKIGLPTDPPMGLEQPAPIPSNLNYSMWLGPAPWAPYSENRVHPQSGYGRPGWLRISDYCLGMITGWGSHYLDIAHWAMNVEHSGPTDICGNAEFPKDGLWDVHGTLFLEYRYSNDVRMEVSDQFQSGVRFEGTDGWIFVSPAGMSTFPDSIMRSPIQSSEIRLYQSEDHMGNFLECIRTRSSPVATATIGHHSNTACILGNIAMRLRRPLQWNSQTESFINDDQADRMLSRAIRSAWML